MFNSCTLFHVLGMERNFLSYSHYPVDSLNEPYDLLSIMHYDNKAFSSNGQDTMQSIRNPKIRFGRFRSLSRVDIRQLTKLYSCSTRLNSRKGRNQEMLELSLVFDEIILPFCLL